MMRRIGLSVVMSRDHGLISPTLPPAKGEVERVKFTVPRSKVTWRVSRRS